LRLFLSRNNPHGLIVLPSPIGEGFSKTISVNVVLEKLFRVSRRRLNQWRSKMKKLNDNNRARTEELMDIILRLATRRS